MSKAIVKTTFEASRTLRPIYTGGSTALDASGRILLSCVGEDALIVDLETGNQLTSLEGDGEIVTGLAITPSASHAIVCSRSMSMRIYGLSTFDETSQTIEAKLLRTLKPHTAPVVTIAVDPTGTLLATGGADGSIKVWDIRGGFVTHTFHGHGGVISALCFFEVPTADSDAKSSKKNKSKQQATEDDDEDMEGSARTVSTAGFRLASGSEDGKMRVWDLHKRKSIASLESHVSLVRSMSFSPSENALISASRDKTVIVWDARTWKTRRIIPVLESVEAAAFIADSGLCVIGGENGKLRVWDCNRGSEVTEEQEAGEEFESVVAIQYSPGLPFVLTVHADQTLRIHSLESLSDYKPGSTLEPLAIIRRISGNDDEIIDLAYIGPDRSMLALATNTESIRGEEYFGADVTHLEGHDDIIICIDADWSGHWLATGAKDNTARLWRIDPKTSSYTCFAIFTGHAESLGAIALPRVPPPVGSAAYNDPLNHPPAFLITGSQDRTIKRWDTSKLAPLTGEKPHHPKAIYTRKAHEKDINAIDIDSTSELFASASQDRTVKIWAADEGSSLGVLRGHKRGVWSVRFAPQGTPIINSDSRTSTSRGLAVTGSGDKTVKLWSLSDYSCLLTFEGHTNSVLKVLWLPPPQVSNNQIDDDEDDEEAATARKNAIQDRPLSPPPPQTAYSTPLPTLLPLVPPDATVTFWTDTTSSTYTAAVNASSARVEQDQELQNYIRAGAYREAITLALQLNHPGRLLSLFTSAINAADDPTVPAEDRERAAASLSGNPSIDEVLQNLDPANLRTLLLRLRDWNTNARTSRVSQRILYALFRSLPASTFVELATQSVRGKEGRAAAGLKDILQALAAYTERHYKRVEELVDDSYLVEWVLGEMDGGVGLGGLRDLTVGDVSDEEEHEKDVIMLEA
ncbi:Small-subunit processome Utp13 [Penicillium expansum]|nr:Small-subunit processome Utp13 [Penicillium expansum]